MDQSSVYSISSDSSSSSESSVSRKIRLKIQEHKTYKLIYKELLEERKQRKRNTEMRDNMITMRKSEPKREHEIITNNQSSKMIKEIFDRGRQQWIETIRSIVNEQLEKYGLAPGFEVKTKISSVKEEKKITKENINREQQKIKETTSLVKNNKKEEVEDDKNKTGSTILHIKTPKKHPRKKKIHHRHSKRSNSSKRSKKESKSNSSDCSSDYSSYSSSTGSSSSSASRSRRRNGHEHR